MNAVPDNNNEHTNDFELSLDEIEQKPNSNVVI